MAKQRYPAAHAWLAWARLSPPAATTVHCVGYVLECRDIVVRRGSNNLLDHVTWCVGEGERWVVLGPNGAGKTTLLLIAATRLFPTSGTVDVLGERLGATDIADLRPLVGWASSALSGEIPPGESVRDTVMTGAYAITGRWNEEYAEQDRRRCAAMLHDWGLAELGQRTFGTLSEGERKRTLIARALMSNPEVLLLDEPGAGLDLGGREDLVARMGALAADPGAPTQVVITHHVEEIPPGFTHALLLRSGTAIAQGRIDDVISEASLSACFGVPLTVRHEDGRFHARRALA